MPKRQVFLVFIMFLIIGEFPKSEILDKLKITNLLLTTNGKKLKRKEIKKFKNG
jgi:hypothetical protein